MTLVQISESADAETNVEKHEKDIPYQVKAIHIHKARTLSRH